MLLEREDGTEIKPGEDVGPQMVKLPKLAKGETPFAYFQKLTMEQAFALTLVAKVSGTTPDDVMRRKLSKDGLTVYPDGNAPQPPKPKTEADLMAGIPFDTKPVELDPRGPSFTMAPEAQEGGDAEADRGV